ncbi:nicotinate-nucleotide adenylyltransferase [Breoghania sp. L-A4]|nr:nicotinate-nucleotide adenylyltransferase [Breoghania sp. L-A4]AXS42355.1 nicotinate-nucleotide adenylyltransferase [Breoghania sp. L-A4]
MRLPPAGHGQRIGLFGGSFNPPHSGHAHVSRIALRRLRLDAVWWLVTPGNPLKNHDELAPLQARVQACKEIAGDPRVHVTAWEALLGTAYTAQTIAALTQRRPDLRFTWIMGADNLAGFHRWQNWRDIVERLPVAIVDRPDSTLAVLGSRLAHAYAAQRVPERDASALAAMRAPAWTFLHGPRDPISSTELRRRSATT